MCGSKCGVLWVAGGVVMDMGVVVQGVRQPFMCCAKCLGKLINHVWMQMGDIGGLVLAVGSGAVNSFTEKE
jgi:hypothetical protein